MIEVARLTGGNHIELPDFLAERRGLLAPLAADEVVGAGVQEVHRDKCKELCRAALEEQDIMRVAKVQQLFGPLRRLVENAFKFLPAMADLGDAKAFALVIEQRRGGFLQRLGRKHRRASTEIENTVGHGGFL